MRRTNPRSPRRATAFRNHSPIKLPRLSVNGAPTVTWAAPAADAILVQGRSVTLDATVADSDGVVARLDYLVDGQALVARTAAPWTAAWTPTTLGAHALTATVTDDRGVTSSVTRSVFVDAAPTVAITSPLDGSLAATGMPLSVQIAAADVDGTVAQVTLTANDRVVAILTAGAVIAVPGGLGCR